MTHIPTSPPSNAHLEAPGPVVLRPLNELLEERTPDTPGAPPEVQPPTSPPPQGGPLHALPSLGSSTALNPEAPPALSPRDQLDTQHSTQLPQAPLTEVNFDLDGLPHLEAALQRAAQHPGAEAIGRNSDGSYSVYPFADDRLDAAQNNDFSGFAQHIVAVSLDGGEWVAAGHPTTQKLVQRSAEIMSRLQDTRYVLGGQTLDFDGGVIHSDCSSFMRALWGEQGVSLAGMNAAQITDYLTHIGGPFERVHLGAALQPGDVIGMKMPEIPTISGHVMLVVGTPEPIVEAGQLLGYNLAIMDTTSLPHGEGDSRGAAGGTGTGRVSVKIDPDDNSIAEVYWRANFQGDSWEPVVGRYHGRTP